MVIKQSILNLCSTLVEMVFIDIYLGDDLAVDQCHIKSTRIYDPKAWTEATEFVPGQKWNSSSKNT